MFYGKSLELDLRGTIKYTWIGGRGRLWNNPNGVRKNLTKSATVLIS